MLSEQDSLSGAGRWPSAAHSVDARLQMPRSSSPSINATPCTLIKGALRGRRQLPSQQSHTWPLSPKKHQQYSGYSLAKALKLASLRAARRLYSSTSSRLAATSTTAVFARLHAAIT